MHIFIISIRSVCCVQNVEKRAQLERKTHLLNVIKNIQSNLVAKSTKKLKSCNNSYTKCINIVWDCTISLAFFVSGIERGEKRYQKLFK